jgi:hypothetical protein
MRNYRCRKGKRRGLGVREDFENSYRGRPLKEIVVDEFPEVKAVIPQPILSEEVVTLTIAEYEALRLVDLEGLNQDEAGELMAVSRGTIWRLLDSAREKLVQVLVSGKKMIVEEHKK